MCVPCPRWAGRDKVSGVLTVTDGDRPAAVPSALPDGSDREAASGTGGLRWPRRLRRHHRPGPRGRRRWPRRSRRAERRRRDPSDAADAGCDAFNGCDGCDGCSPLLTLAALFSLLSTLATIGNQLRAAIHPRGPQAPEDASGASVTRSGLAMRGVLTAIRAYQRAVSPRRPARCHYTPTCSAFAAEAIACLGLAAGAAKTARRLRACRPGAGRAAPDLGRPHPSGRPSRLPPR
ncbi:membrane protein insertion efficiency factor YidD [Parafrankia sp. FMc2]|uniref:membrane protein insertion efficiency factor YidD n=1 Tax=Parafrankia sp. FMc2 TaxID=3233196 RepID=UPI0034D44CF2